MKSFVRSLKILKTSQEKNIEKLKMLESTVIKQSEKIQNIEDKLKDTDLKVFEQTKEIDILKKKMRVLKENESKVMDLEFKLEEVVKKVNEAFEKEISRNKCSECEFVAKSEEVLKVHFKLSILIHRNLNAVHVIFLVQPRLNLQLTMTYIMIHIV